MPKIQKEIMQIPARIKRKYSDQELSKFNDMIQKFYCDHELQAGPQKGEIVRVLDKYKLAVAYGAMVVKDSFGCPVYRIIGDEVEGTQRWDQFENLMDQWSWWKAKNVYGEEKRIEELDQIAEQMTISSPDDLLF